jgi:hypothetical protein
MKYRIIFALLCLAVAKPLVAQQNCSTVLVYLSNDTINHGSLLLHTYITN